MLNRLIDLLAKGMDAAGLNGTRLRWRWNQRRRELGESGMRAIFTWRSARGKHKMCPSCRALVPRGAGKCPRCGTSISAVRGPGLGRTFSNAVPGLSRATTLILLANCFWFLLMVMVLVRDLGQDGLTAMIWVSDDISAEFNHVLLRFGALYGGFFNGLTDGWRLIPPIFVHGGLLHIFFNSYILLRIGPMVEEEYGRERMWIAYLVTGIVGFVASLVWGMVTGSPRFAVGASGAILGLMGLLVAYGIRRGGTIGARIKNNIMQFVLVIFLISFLVGNVDHLAHAGGLVSGFALGFVIPYGPYRSREAALLWKGIAGAACLVVLFAFYMVRGISLQ